MLFVVLSVSRLKIFFFYPGVLLVLSGEMSLQQASLPLPEVEILSFFSLSAQNISGFSINLEHLFT